MAAARAAVAAALLFAAPAGCGVTGPSWRGTIVLDNVSDTAVVVLPVELSLAALIDLAPTLTLPDDQLHVLHPGGSMEITVDDILGDFEPGTSGLALYVYEAAAAEAVYAGVLQLDATGLARLLCHLRLDRVRPPGLR